MTEKRIIIDPKIMAGKPIIKGTRVPVYVVLGSLAGGMDYKEVMGEYGLKFRDVLACLNYAADVVVSEEAYPLVKKGG
jgi:uncharacterized protein (DUF433 family)